MSLSRSTQQQRQQGSWNDLPVELIELILQYVTREDAKSLRRVSKGIEGKVSPTFFRSVVVPFNSELQDMVKRDIQARSGEYGKGKGKRLAVDEDQVIAEQSTLPWMQKPFRPEHDPYRGHGYKVFSGFGRHIRNFGMSFEVTEDDLRRPPLKQILDNHESFYGSYQWPPPNYRRFDTLASLERTADEISHLRGAMAHLIQVKALGLSLNNGHGWLSGAVFEENTSNPLKPEIFGRAFRLPRQTADRNLEITDFPIPPRWLRPAGIGDDALQVVRERMMEWRTRARGAMPRLTVRQARAWHEVLENLRHREPELRRRLLQNARLDLFDIANTDDNSDEEDNVLNWTDLLPEPVEPATECRASASSRALIPGALTQTQKEWLLEADWAQRAFLQSYMLSIIDNKDVFHSIKTFTFAFLSSRFVPMLCRQDFWSAFPGLQNLSLLVSPDWRQMERADDQIVDTAVSPSEAHNQVFGLLVNFISKISSVTEIEVGWARSAEEACDDNIRTAHLLPAPICPLAESHSEDPSMLVDLPWVQHLKLTNCYVTSQALKGLSRLLQEQDLCQVTLRNISLLITARHARYLQRENRPVRTRNRNGLIDINERPPFVRFGSWTSTLNDLTPAEQIDGLESEDGQSRHPRKLDRINLHSCGYAICRGPADIDINDIAAIGNQNNINQAAAAPQGLPQAPMPANRALPAWLPNPRGGRAAAPAPVAALAHQGIVPVGQAPPAAAGAQAPPPVPAPVPPGPATVPNLPPAPGPPNRAPDAAEILRDIAAQEIFARQRSSERDTSGDMTTRDPYLGHMMYETFTHEYMLLRTHFGLDVPEEYHEPGGRGNWHEGEGPRFSGSIVRLEEW